MRMIPIQSPMRFRSYEDALAFMTTGDKSKTIPQAIIVGQVSVLNPEYVNAPFELGVLTADECDIPQNHDTRNRNPR